MNKKILGALSLPLLVAACSSEDLMTTPQGENGQYDVAKVDVSLVIDDAQTRLATGWTEKLEKEDELGFAWLGDNDAVKVDGRAFQNHPLYSNGDNYLQPATSIYVGKYYSYYPYNDEVVSVREIPFTLEGQPFAEGVAGYNDAAKNSIWISPKWTDVTEHGEPYTENNKAGRKNTFTISPQQFTNKVLLHLNYTNADIDQGNTSIYGVSVALKDASDQDLLPTKFTYKPEVSTDAANWTGHALAAQVTALTPGADGKTPMPAPAQVNGVSATYGKLNLVVGSNGYEILPSNTDDDFAFNALPAGAAVQPNAKVEVVMNTTYGVLTISEKVTDVAYTRLDGKEYAEKPDGVKDSKGDLLGAVDLDRSFVQVLGSTGKFVLEADFSKAVMDGMCVIDDIHLQKLLNYYISKKKNSDDEAINESKQGTDIVLNLNATNGEFRLSQTSIELLQKINPISGDKLVSIRPCTDHGTPAIVITGGKEVPNLDRVFEHEIDNVTLANEAWTWNNDAKKNFGNVKQITNEGTVTIESVNVETTNGNYNYPIVNDGIINIESIAKTKVNVTNNGTINVAEDAELRAYGVIVNNVTAVTGVRQGNWGVINNSGVIGIVADVNATSGEIHNYGLIEHKTNAITWVTTNQTSTVSFAKGMSADNKIGIINITEADASVSITNTTDKGIITYTWEATEDGVYVTPKNVKYNYLIVKDDIAFNEDAAEILYLEFAGKRTIFTAASGVLTGATDPERLNGVIVAEGNSVQLEKGNYLTTKAAYVKGTIYNGGTFAVSNNNFVTYFGGDNTTDVENVVKQK